MEWECPGELDPGVASKREKKNGKWLRPVVERIEAGASWMTRKESIAS